MRTCTTCKREVPASWTRHECAARRWTSCGKKAKGELAGVLAFVNEEDAAVWAKLFREAPLRERWKVRAYDRTIRMDGREALVVVLVLRATSGSEDDVHDDIKYVRRHAKPTPLSLVPLRLS